MRPCVHVCSVAKLCLTLFDPESHEAWTPAKLLCPWDSLGKNTSMSCHFLLQRIFPTQGLTHATLVAQRLKRLLVMQETWVRNIPWRRKRQPTPVLLSGESHGQRSLVGYSPRGLKESDTPERLHFLSLSLSCAAHRFFPAEPLGKRPPPPCGRDTIIIILLV